MTVVRKATTLTGSKPVILREARLKTKEDRIDVNGNS